MSDELPVRDTERPDLAATTPIAAIVRVRAPESAPPAKPNRCGLARWGTAGAAAVCDGAAHYDAGGAYLELCPARLAEQAAEERAQRKQELLAELRVEDERRLAGLRARLHEEAEHLAWKRGRGIGLESFDPRRDQGGDNAFEAARRFVRRPFHVLFQGDNGTGKTGLLVAIRDALVRAGEPALYCSASEWRTWLQRAESFNRDVAAPAERWLERIELAPVLLVDELAARDGDARNDAFPAALAGLFDRSPAKIAVAMNGDYAALSTICDAWARVVDRLRAATEVIIRGAGARGELR